MLTLGSKLTIILRQRTAFSIALLVISVISIVGIVQLKFDDDYRSLFRTATQEFADFESLLSHFGTDENDFVIVIESDPIYSAETLSMIGRMHKELARQPGIERVISVHSLRSKRRVGRYFLPLIPGRLDADNIDTIADKIREHPLGGGQIVSKDGRATLLIATLAKDQSAVSELEVYLEDVDQVIEQQSDDATKLSITGLPALRVNVVRGIQRDQVVFSIVAVVVALFIAWLMFRAFTPIFIACAAPALGTLWTLGVMGWIGQDLNVLNSVVPVLILIIGFTDSGHLMFFIRKCRDEGASPFQAAWSALREVGPACVLTSLTTAIGFGSLMMIADALIQGFAITCVIGTTAAVFAVLAAAPILASTKLGINCVSVRSKKRKSADRYLLRMFIDRLLKYPRLVVGVGVILVVGFIVAGFGLRPDFQFTENLPQSNESFYGLRRCDDVFGGNAMLHVVVSVPEHTTLREAEHYQVLRDVHEIFESRAETSEAISLMNLLESMPRKGSLEDRVRELSHLPIETVKSFYSPKHKEFLVTARVKDLGSAELSKTFAAMRGSLLDIEREFPNYHCVLTGVPVISTHRSQDMIPDLASSLGVASVLVFLVIGVAFRSTWLGLASIVPNVFPLAATAALYSMIGYPLRYSVVVCFSLCLGIAVDDTIHFLAHYQRESKRTKNSRVALRRAFVEITPILITTTLLMTVGFGVTLLSVMPTIQLFGLTSCSAIVFALFADLIFLPAILLVISFKRRSSTSV